MSRAATGDGQRDEGERWEDREGERKRGTTKDSERVVGRGEEMGDMEKSKKVREAVHSESWTKTNQ